MRYLCHSVGLITETDLHMHACILRVELTRGAPSFSVVAGQESVTENLSHKLVQHFVIILTPPTATPVRWTAGKLHSLDQFHFCQANYTVPRIQQAGS